MGENTFVNLAKMKIGQSGTVRELGMGKGIPRVIAMGLRPGCRITKVSGMFGHGPVTIQISQSQLAVGYGMAQKIIVEVDDP